MTRTHDRYSTYREDQREFFDSLVTADWDAYRDPAWDRARRFELDRLFAIVDVRRVIDLGCGVGFHDLEMARDHGVEEVLGVDYSERSIEAAEREYPHPRVRRRVADLFELAPGNFDLAVSFQVIEHLPRADRFLAACANQVRSGGWVGVFTPNRLRLSNRLLGLQGRELELADPQHFREYSRRELEELGRDTGLAPVAHFGYGLSAIVPRLGWELVPRRGSLRLGWLLPAVASGICVVFRRD